MRPNSKELILQKAIKLFAVKGFNASTTAEIAQRAIEILLYGIANR